MVQKRIKSDLVKYILNFIVYHPNRYSSVFVTMPFDAVADGEF